jgi:hypothetical protein
MSRPEPVPLCRRSGITLLEAMLVLSLFSFLTAASFQALNSTSEASRRLDAVNRVHVRSQLVLDRVVAEAAASVQIYGDDSEGWSVLSLLQGVTGEMLPDSKLPALLNDGIVEKDLSGAIDTGNCLVVLKAILPFGLKSTTTTEEVRRVDIYRFVAVYLTNKEPGSPLDRPDGLDLVLFRSEPLADWAQVSEVTDPVEQERLLLALRDERGVRLLIDTRMDIDDALATIDAFGNINSHPPSSLEIKPNPLHGRKSLFPQPYLSVATNAAPKHFGVGRLTPRINTGSGFPHGFEIRIIGSPTARRIFSHLTVALRKGRDRFYADLDSVAVARDF